MTSRDVSRHVICQLRYSVSMTTAAYMYIKRQAMCDCMCVYIYECIMHECCLSVCLSAANHNHHRDIDFIRQENQQWLLSAVQNPNIIINLSVLSSQRSNSR